MMKKIRTIRVFLLLVCLLCGGMTKTVTITAETLKTEVKAEETKVPATPEAKEEIVAKNGMKLSMTYGYEKSVKYRRYLRIDAQVTNEGKDFVGALQVIIPSEEGNNVMYQRETAIAAGESKKIALSVPINTFTKKLNVKLLDSMGQVIVKKKIKINIEGETSILFTGVLTDERNYLGYLSGDRTKVFYLTEETLADDDKGLDTLDVIVINNFNTSKLSDAQYKALKEWVNVGGTLVLGTGITGNKTLEIFKDDFLTGEMGKVDKNGNLDFVMQGASVAAVTNTKTNIQYLDKGLGRIIVFPLDMGLEYQQWESVGNAYVGGITENLSGVKRAVFNGISEMEDVNYEIYESLNIGEGTNLPKVGKYATVLCIYLILIGPPLYFILKKKDKRNLTWVLVPIFSILFSIGIYILGSDTRITKPYIRFMKFCTLDGKGVDKGTEDTYFSITAPYNKKYNVAVPQGVDVNALSNIQGYYYDGEEEKELDLDSYKTGIKYSGENTILQLKDYAAFDSAYFTGKEYREEAGTYKENIINHDFNLSGSFENELGYDIKNAILVCDKTIVNLGDIKNGEEIQIDSIKKENIYYTPTEDTLNEEEIIAKIAGGDPYGKGVDADIARRYYAMQGYIAKSYRQNGQSNYILGFVYNESDEAMKEQWGFESEGISVVVIPVNAAYTKKDKTFIPSIEKYMKVIDGTLSASVTDRYIYEDTLVEYQFDKKDKILSICYGAEMNREFKGKRNWNSFYGKVSAYNYKTQEYDEIFSSAKESELTELKNYINEDNKMLLKYQIDNKNKDSDCVIPIISATKEAK